MSTEAISKKEFIREFVRELHNKNAAVFIGAGLSVGSGHIDWKELLKDIVISLELDPNEEEDLVTIAQYHCNQQGTKSHLTQTIVDFFSKEKKPSRNHEILSALPINTYWTTNYDKLIEVALSQAKKTPDVKHTIKQLATTRPDRDAVVYKMHGDVDHAADAIISKDDYEAYPFIMQPFVNALKGDLIEKTFLFLGFSFTDPNIDYILSRVKVVYESNSRTHYCIQKKVDRLNGESEEKFARRKIKQDYFIRDLKRFAIQTILVDDYPEITSLLEDLSSRYRKRSVFISGAAHEFGEWSRNEAEGFLHNVGHQLLRTGNRIITGFGLGVGGPVLNGALEFINSQGKTISEDDVVLRPFPQTSPPGTSLKDQWMEYREEMIQHAGIAVFLFGNKEDDKGEVILSDGMEKEFEIAKQQGLMLLPVGATGFMAKKLWDRISSDFDQYFPKSSNQIKEHFNHLGDASRTPEELRATLLTIISDLQKG